MRDQKRLAEIRKLPCVRCGMHAPSQACHSNWSKHGKGRGIKADDKFTIPLCAECHKKLDLYLLGNREESEALFMQWLDKTNRMLNQDIGEVF